MLHHSLSRACFGCVFFIYVISLDYFLLIRLRFYKQGYVMRLFFIIGCIVGVMALSGCAAKKQKPSGVFVSTKCDMVCSNTECNQVCTQVEGTLK